MTRIIKLGKKLTNMQYIEIITPNKKDNAINKTQLQYTTEFYKLDIIQ